MSGPRNLKVAIIGAGPAGCTLARLLLNESNIDVTLFEGEKSLPLISNGGVASKSTSRGRPEIDRIRLRQLLVESLPKGVIQWGKRLRSVDPEDLSLQVDDGGEIRFDLVVGADGAWSKVRPVVSPVQPYFVGLVGEDDSLTVYAWNRGDENWQDTCGYDVKDPIQLKKHIISERTDWDPSFQEALQVTNDEQITARNIYSLPVGHEWRFRPGVTSIGDEAHMMTPFAGQGVNIVMEDAMKLADAIVTAKKMGAEERAVNNSIRLFEVDMFRRAAPVAEHSIEDMYFTPGAPKTTIAR